MNEQLETRFREERARMVRDELRGRGIRDERVLAAMGSVPREVFVPTVYLPYTYSDRPLPLPSGQTISQPYVVALMLQVLRVQPNDRVLEVGSGSGYASAVLSEMAAEVVAIERQPVLVDYATERLAQLGMQNVRVVLGDGSLGCPAYAPYDKILVSAGGPHIPPSLKRQLAIGGRLVMPVGPHRRNQKLVRVIRRAEEKFDIDHISLVAFVPLIGEEGWSGNFDDKPDPSS